MSENQRCLQEEPGNCLRMEPDTNAFFPYPSVRPEVSASGSSGITVSKDKVEVEHECQDQAGAEEIEEQAMGGESEDAASEFRAECSGSDERDHGDDHDRVQGPAKDVTPGEEEMDPPRVAVQPRLPSRDEVDVHEAMGHAQYRNWCETCIYGQGREDLHLRGENGGLSRW